MLDFRRLYRWFQSDILAIPMRDIILVFAIVVFCLPLVTTYPYLLKTLIMMFIFSVFAVSYDFLGGFTGQLSVGHALFLGVAAYTAALLNKYFGLAPWATIPVGALAGVGAGLLVAAPALRLRGFYLALVSLAFPLILTGIINAFPEFTGGELGLYGIAPLSQNLVTNYYIVLLVGTICIMIMWKLTDTKSKIVRLGLILQAIREDEIGARTAGIDTRLYKILAFAISGLFAGVAGGLYAHTVRVAGPSTLELWLSFQAIIWTIFGGAATIYGPVMGVVILYPLVQLISIFQWGEQIRYALLAAVIVVVILYMPQGIASWVREHIEEVCPRCKEVNAVWRRQCRACDTNLHLEKSTMKVKEEGK